VSDAADPLEQNLVRLRHLVTARQFPADHQPPNEELVEINEDLLTSARAAPHQSRALAVIPQSFLGRLLKRLGL
jgi:hypothetical protein